MATNRLSRALLTREAEALLGAIRVSSGESEEEAINTAIVLYHAVLTGEMFTAPDFHGFIAAAGAKRAEVLELMGHV